MKITIFRSITLIAVIALVLGTMSTTTASAASITYYVSPAGSDTNPGSLSAPFKTFAKAVSMLQAGDTLQVMAGTYTEPLVMSRSGTASAPITLLGENAVLNMQGVNANGISVSGSFVRVLKFEVTGATDFGILVTGKDVTLENNVVHDTVTKNGVGTCGISTSWGSAVKVKVGAENTTIRNNTVYNNCGEGIAVTRGIKALVEGNTVWDNFGVNIYVDNSPYVTVQNNHSYCTGTHLRDGNRATGVALGEESYSGWGAQLHDIQVVGNTITDCRTGVAAYESYVGGTLTNVSILNNNIPSGQKRSISLQTLSNQNVQVSNNIIFNDIYVYAPTGVTLASNSLVGSGSTMTPTASLPTATNTVAPVASPTRAWTSTPLPASPTALPGYTSTPLPTLPAFTPTSAETIYDDKNSRFVYSSGWQTMTKPEAYNGSFRMANKNGTSVSFPFTGQTFSIIYKGGPAFRSVDVYVDGVRVGTINQRMDASTFQLRWNYPGTLAAGNHTLKLVFVTTNTSGQTYGSIDAVIVR